MSKEILRQEAWNAGELDPDLLARQDVKVTANAAALLENVLTVPQGPAVRRPGFAFIDVARHVLQDVSLGNATITAPQGGNVSLVADADGTPMLTTTDLAAVNPYVILEIDFGAPTRVDLVDLTDYGLHDTDADVAPATAPVTYPWGAPVILDPDNLPPGVWYDPGFFFPI